MKKIKTTISRIGYNNKPTADEISYMGFDERELTIDEVVNYSVNGYVFCANFDLSPDKKYTVNFQDHSTEISAYYLKRPKGCPDDINMIGSLRRIFMTSDHFRSRQMIFVDIDGCDIGPQEFVKRLSIQPTYYYCTFSDIVKDGRRRFRLVYCMDYELTRDIWVQVSMAVNNMVLQETGVMPDKCGCREVQIMYGGNNKNDVWCSYNTFNPEDFVKFSVPEEDWRYWIKVKSPSNTSEGKIFELTNIIATNSSKDLEALDNRLEQDITEWYIAHPTYCPRLAGGDIDTQAFTDYINIIKKWARNDKNLGGYKIIERTEPNFWRSIIVDGKEYKWNMVDSDNYLQLWHYESGIHDGNGRRQSLQNDAYRMRLIDPSCSINDVLLSLFSRAIRYIDNRDGVVGYSVLINKSKAAFSNYDNLDEFYKNNIGWQMSWIDICKSWDRKFVIKKEGKIENETEVKNAIRHTILHDNISTIFNPLLSDAENVQTLKKNGIEVERTTLVRYRKEHNLNRREFVLGFIRNLMESGKTDDEILKTLKERGLKVSRTTYWRLKKDLGEIEEKKPVVNPFLDAPTFDFGFGKIEMPEENKNANPFSFLPPPEFPGFI